MGQRFSFESLNQERYEEARLSPDAGLWAECSTVPFPMDTKPSNLRDDNLWEEFGQVIDQELIKVNKHYPLVIGLSTVLALVLMLALVGTAAQTEGSENSAIISISLAAVYAVIILVGVGAQFWIRVRNLEVDKTIEGYCEKYRDRFQQHGIIPEYRTKFTGICKPKGARPLRLLVFKPANGP